jgi:Glycosyltransferase family 87
MSPGKHTKSPRAIAGQLDGRISTMKPVPYYVLALAMALPAALVAVEIPYWLSLGSQRFALQSDLRVFYTPGYMLRTGQAKDIYNFSAIRRNQDEKVAPDNGAVPFLHPAYEAVFFMPLSFLPYRAAYIVWAGVNFAILGLIYFLLRPCLPNLSAVGPKWIPPALLLGFMPVAFTILAGQDSLFLLLILVLVYRRIGSNELQAGVLLGLGMFRFQVLLPIVALFLLWRSLKFVAGWVVGSAAVLSVSVAITGVGAQIQYARLLRQMGSVSIWLLLRRMPNLRGLFAAYDFGMVPLALVSLSVLLVAAVIGARQNAQQRLLLAVSVSALVTYYLFLHDLSVLALPVLLAINEAVDRRDWVRTALASAVLSGFAVLWFARSKLYLGALFTLFFFGTQAAGLWKQWKDTKMLRGSDLL